MVRASAKLKFFDLNSISCLQRKSHAPSSLARYSNAKPAFKPPLLEPISDRKSRKVKADNENIAPPEKMSLSEHEAKIQKILSRPFKVPIADYIPEFSNKSLGLKRVLIRRQVVPSS